MKQQFHELRKQAGPYGPNPEELLYTVEPNRRRIMQELLIRLAVWVFALVIFIVRQTGLPLLIATAVVLLTAVLWPLRHWNDGMELRRAGVVYRDVLYPVNGKAVWVGARVGFLPSTFLELPGRKRRIDVSFMKDAEKLFARAYGNVIS